MLNVKQHRCLSLRFLTARKKRRRAKRRSRCSDCSWSSGAIESRRRREWEKLFDNRREWWRCFSRWHEESLRRRLVRRRKDLHKVSSSAMTKVQTTTLIWQAEDVAYQAMAGSAKALSWRPWDSWLYITFIWVELWLAAFQHLWWCRLKCKWSTLPSKSCCHYQQCRSNWKEEKEAATLSLYASSTSCRPKTLSYQSL